MDDLGAGVAIGLIAGCIVGVAIGGAWMAHHVVDWAAVDYGKQHCEAKCAPHEYTAKWTDTKFACSCLVPVTP